MSFSSMSSFSRSATTIDLSTTIDALRGDVVVSAERVSRQIESKAHCGKEKKDHWGVLIKTQSGKYGLIESAIDTGINATIITDLSDKWKFIKKIDVKGKKTLGWVLEQFDVFSHKKEHDSIEAFLEYIFNGLCYGAARTVEKNLKK